MTLRNERTTVTRKWGSGGGIAYLERKLQIGMRNRFNFKLDKIKSQNFYIGLEDRSEKRVWVWNVLTGEKCQHNEELKDYNKYEFEDGDIITMDVFEDGLVVFIVNQRNNLGPCFKDKSLFENQVYPFVYLHAKGERISVFQGTIGKRILDVEDF